MRVREDSHRSLLQRRIDLDRAVGELVHAIAGIVFSRTTYTAPSASSHAPEFAATMAANRITQGLLIRAFMCLLLSITITILLRLKSVVRCRREHREAAMLRTCIMENA